MVTFGSQITGEATDASDLDIAVKFSDDLSSSERFEERCFLSGDLQQERWPFIDISDIETLPLDVAHDPVNGTLVCGDEHAFGRFKETIEATFDDQRDDLRRQQRAVISDTTGTRTEFGVLLESLYRFGHARSICQWEISTPIFDIRSELSDSSSSRSS
ncbi:nucleotidyltransferase domain-containing protein [Halogeometricum luteum]|uniref:Nucleotidyltransferase domain-containing protein n=1 Tax=Halogeometricum luteum TaxID=2950537 RepID=A0ABU2G276_9EURY|nr:nucleotidyltransferase domain-containing protein [Halogeometricum sp. S3BR5-2]MDS0294896.1 nucleotidyltransferase domain-containing protein [Halogeometricum sp. S3BR5-2]